MKGKGGYNKKRRLLIRRGQPEGSKQAQTQATLAKYKMLWLERKVRQALDEVNFWVFHSCRKKRRSSTTSCFVVVVEAVMLLPGTEQRGEKLNFKSFTVF